MFGLLLAVIYLSFISLGLPDALLGAAWPTMHAEMSVPLSWAGAISMTISLGTVVSSLMSERLTARLGDGRVTAFSVALTAAVLFGFSVSRSFAALVLCAVPYGLGAGSVDAALNNYVALHFKSRHMSWLHCMWGIGAAGGPYIMQYAIASARGWQAGYRFIGILQLALTAILFLSLPIWSGRGGEREERRRALPLREVLRIPGAKDVMVMFFCYCALESTAMLWASSYMAEKYSLGAAQAAGYGALFCLGITAGRFISGFATFRLDDTQMIRLGLGIIAAGLGALLISRDETLSVCALVVAGLGCAPIYPSVIHSTPGHFGAENSQAVIGVQMASAYLGSLLTPPLFGLLAQKLSLSYYPRCLGILLILMATMHECLLKHTTSKKYSME